MCRITHERPVQIAILVIILIVCCGSVLQLFEGAAELIGTGCTLGTAADTVDLGDHIIDLLTAYELADALEVAVAASKEEHLLDDIVLVGGDVDQLGTGAVGLILYVLGFHKLNLICG